eukprot:6192095-Pleurochrysis_carterae.AAC.1
MCAQAYVRNCVRVAFRKCVHVGACVHAPAHGEMPTRVWRVGYAGEQTARVHRLAGKAPRPARGRASRCQLAR